MAIQKLGFSGTPNLIHSVGGVGYLTTTVAGGSLVAPSSGIATKMYVYKYTEGTNAIGSVVLYDDVDQKNIIASASFNLSGAVGWREVTISDTAIVAGSTYYPMLLVANGNSLMYSDTSGNNCSRVGSLLTPPDPWTEIQNRAYCSAVYVEWDDGASSTSCIGSGEIVFSGSSNNLTDFFYSGSGSVNIIGNVGSLLSLNYSGIGIGEIAGNSEYILSLIESGGGSLLFGGEATTYYSGVSDFSFIGSGLLTLDGYSSNLFELLLNGNGNLNLIGDSNNLIGFLDMGSGEVLFNGSASTTYGSSSYQFVGSGEVLFSGTGINDSISGLMKIAFNSKTNSITFTIKKPIISFIGNSGE